jgi:transcriptional antiterminator NusG
MDENHNQNQNTSEAVPEEKVEAPVAPQPTVEQQAEAKEPTPAVEEQPVPTPAQPGKWYVIHVKTGYEGRVKQALEQRIKSLGVAEQIFDIVVPTREVVVVKKGKKSKIKEKVFPGYVLIRMIMNDDSWLVVRTTEGITGFVGAGLKPTPISDKEVEAIMKFVKQEQPKFKTKFSVGEAVKIIEGPFADFLGSIQAIDEEKGKVRVLVSIFDRETPVELDFLQVAKL